MIYRGLLNGAIVALLYMAYRHRDELQMLILCIAGAAYFIRQLYFAEKLK